MYSSYSVCNFSAVVEDGVHEIRLLGRFRRIAFIGKCQYLFLYQSHSNFKGSSRLSSSHEIFDEIYFVNKIVRQQKYFTSNQNHK